MLVDIGRLSTDMHVARYSIADLVYERHLSADMSVDTRPIYQSALDRYLDRHSAGVSHSADRVVSRPTRMSAHARSLSHRRLADTKPIPYRQSADTLPTVGRFSTDTWSALSALFLYSDFSRLRCPLHLVPTLSVAFVLCRSCRPHSFLSLCFFCFCFFCFCFFFSLLPQTLWFMAHMDAGDRYCFAFPVG